MKIIENISYGSCGCLLDCRFPEAPGFPVVLFFHGGALEGGSRKDNADLMAQLAENGIGAVSADYRMYPGARYPQFIEDAAEAARWTKENMAAYGAGRALYISGSSAGAYLSMMLLFDRRYLGAFGISPNDMAGYILNAGQPTTHFNVLRERGLDSRRVIVDEAAPLYHVGENPDPPRLLLLAAGEDIPGRLEQTRLLRRTLLTFGYPVNRVTLKVMEGFGHCEYDHTPGQPDGTLLLCGLIRGFVREK